VPSKKQRRKREKERRHEYEIVLIDETGEEIPVDPDELRSQREKEGPRAKNKDGKKAPARGRGSVREVKPPSWDRVWKRAIFFAIFMFLVLSFIGNKHGTVASKLVPTVLYTALFVPFLYLMDRVQYRQYLRRTGQDQQAARRSRQRSARDDASSNTGTGLTASLRRAFRR
jgi:hypothetical protein